MTAAKRLLLVDDYQGNLEIFSVMAELLGHTLVVAKSGQEALEKCLSQRFDLVFMDIQLPDMTGYEVARKILQADYSQAGSEPLGSKPLSLSQRTVEGQPQAIPSAIDDSQQVAAAQQPPILGFSADVTEDKKRRCAEVGMVGVEIKSVNLSDLQELIDKYARP